jgi:hypothetical protein
MLLLVAPVAALLPATAVHAAGTCHGQAATIEGAAGSVLGTSGDDVIVVTGLVTRVEAGDGNDLICVVDTRKVGGPQSWLGVDAGAGDDVVDASAAGAKTRAYLPAGADSYLGGKFNDEVAVGLDSTTWKPTGAPGPYSVVTGAGKDALRMGTAAVVDADLGAGADALTFSPSFSDASVFAGPGSTFDLGSGRDRAYFNDWWEYPGGGYQTTLVVDLPGERLKWWGVESTLRGVEDVAGAALRGVVSGTDRDNAISVDGCNVLLKGAGGDDRLTTGNYAAEDGPSCGTAGAIRHRVYGNAGDDHLSGTAGYDVLIGGPGYDLAFGGQGRDDRCEVERSWGKGCSRH